MGVRICNSLGIVGRAGENAKIIGAVKEVFKRRLPRVKEFTVGINPPVYRSELGGVKSEGRTQWRVLCLGSVEPQ
jgi:hypothetical protein